MLTGLIKKFTGFKVGHNASAASIRDNKNVFIYLIETDVLINQEAHLEEWSRSK